MQPQTGDAGYVGGKLVEAVDVDEEAGHGDGFERDGGDEGQAVGGDAAGVGGGLRHCCGGWCCRRSSSDEKPLRDGSLVSSDPGCFVVVVVDRDGDVTQP